MITFENVNFAYPEQLDGKIKNFNLSIADGECVLLCGKSGCGKTTITRLLNGLIPYFFKGDFEGSITIDGKEVSSVPMYELAQKVGSVFQNPRTQFFNVDTDSEIAFGIENQALPREKIIERVTQTIMDLKIEELSNRSIFSLSGGEKQKIAFASVYAMSPNVLILDEPSSNLDTKAIEDLKDYLRTVKSQGKTVIITEHRLYYLMELVDKIVFIENGKIEKIYNKNEFRSIPLEELNQMGLRATNLSEISPSLETINKQQGMLQIQDLTLKFKKHMVLSDVSFTANQGEIIGVTGYNGSGKTTFCRALCGLHKDCTGEFSWNGSNYGKKNRRENSYLVMQDVNYQLFTDSVENECSFGVSNPNAEYIEEILTQLGLSSFRERHPFTLSGGQKQRVAVAVSMVCKREILIFDEPTSGLDFDSMMQVATLLHSLSKQGKLIFVVSHDYEFVLNVCSRIMHFNNQKLTEDFEITNENKLKKVFHEVLDLKEVSI